MKKSKGQTVDLLYINKNETKKTKSAGVTSSRPQKSRKNKKKKIQSNNNKKIDLDNEIIIGLTPKKEEKGKKKTTQKVKKTETNKSSYSKEKNSKSKKNKNKIKGAKQIKKLKIIKITTIIILAFTAIIMFMMSSVFNIRQIVVSNNTKISSEEIISLSKLTIGTNMFKVMNKSVNNNIKINPYIENVKIKKNLNGTVTLEVKERVATYMLKIDESYIYINNQGYILETTNAPLEIPIITGFDTPIQEIKEGNRLVVDDLKKIEDIIKIMDLVKNSSLASIITSIDISEQSNYKLTILSEGKTVQFGDIRNAKIKILKIEEVLQQEKGINGEIYFQDSEKTVFRETVNF